MRNRSFIAGIVAIFVTLQPATAQTINWTQCEQAPPRVRIASCTEIIRKGGLSNRDLARAYAVRGNAFTAAEERDKARADFTAALRLAPDGANGHYYKANLHRLSNELDQALAELTHVLAIDPNHFLGLQARGAVHRQKGNFDQAIADLDAAVKLQPRSGFALNNRGSVWSSKGDREKAIADFTEAIRIMPQLVQAYTNRARAYSTKGDYEAAIRDVGEAIKLEPDRAIHYVQRGIAQLARKDHEMAIADLDAALRLDPSHFEATMNRGNAYLSKGDRERAREDFKSAIALDKLNGWPFNNLGLLAFSSGDYAQAIANYNTAIGIQPAYAIAYMNRGNAHASNGHTELAIADYRRVLELPATAMSDKQRHEIARERLARLMERPKSPPGAQPPPPFKHRRVALVIGNSKYENTTLLANPANDARAIAAALRRLQFGVVTEIYDATREQMTKALRDFGDNAEGAEWALVYFAGHGLEVGGSTYLIPVDAVLKRDTHVEEEAVSLGRIQAKVDAAGKIGLIILDSCRNNPFLTRMVRSAGATRSVSQGLAMIEPEGNVTVAYAAKHGTVAEDGAGKHSPFTESLLAHIEEPGLEVNFLFRKVRDDVRRKTDRRQDPHTYSTLGSELMYFRPKAR